MGNWRGWGRTLGALGGLASTLFASTAASSPPDLGAIATPLQLPAQAGPADDDALELATRSPRVRKRLDVSGNAVFSPNVYEAVVGLSPTTPITLRVARRAETEILRFLRASGYELARVAARARGDVIEVVVDEGRLRRVVFPGQDAMHAIGMSLALELKSNVFNRPDLEAKLPQLERQFGVTITGWELVPAKTKGGRDFGIPGLPGFNVLSDWLQVPTDGAWELYVYSVREELPPGWELNADILGPDGLTASLLYRWRSVFLRDDRVEVAPEVGLRVQDVVEDGEGRRFWSRAGASVRWVSPPIGSAKVRPFLWPRALVISRQRRDLDIQLYDFFQFDPVLGARIPLGDDLSVGLGAGVQYRNLILVRQEPGTEFVERLDPNDEVRALFEVTADLRLGGDPLRIDRRHHIDVLGRAYSLLGDQELYYLRARYEKVFGFGFDDFEIGAMGETMVGDVTFTDEVRIADHVRGLFGDEFYTDHIVSLKLEYRYAVLTNVLKLAAFHDGTLFRGVDRRTGREFPRVANAFGVGINAVIFEVFEASLYGAFGFMSEGPSDAGLVFSLRQLF